MTENAFTQTEVEENITWFKGNTEYADAQRDLPLYQYIELMVSRELEGQRELLDIGNGGFFNYDTGLVDRVTAVDILVEDGPGPTANSVFKKGSLLDLPLDDESFDCVLLQNVLHHVVGRTVQENHKNLSHGMSEIYRCLRTDGKLVIIESTVGNWFYVIERLLFRPLLAVKRSGHPVTFQYTPAQIMGEAESLGLELVEYSDVPSRGLFILQFGEVWPTLLTPARPVKLVWTKQ